MRIIAGTLKGRELKSPVGHRRTHPMAEKVRGSLFNVLGDIEGLTVLDAFAGSGAISLEAISRGASSALAIDVDKRAYQATVDNAQALGVADKVKVVRASAGGWSDNNPDVVFDLVISAPPYDDLQQNLVKKLVRHTKSGGLYILDWPGSVDAPDLEDLKLLEAKQYGGAQLVFYRKVG